MDADAARGGTGAAPHHGGDDAAAPRGSSYLHALHATKEQRQKAGGGQLSDVLSAGDNEWGLSTEDASARPPSGSRETLFLPAVPPDTHNPDAAHV